MNIIIGLLFGFVCSAAVHAGSDIELLLQRVQKNIAAQQQHENSRLSYFREHQLQRAELLTQAQSELEAAKAQQQQLLTQFNLAQGRVSDQSAQLLQRSGDLQLVFSLARKYAADFSAALGSSLTSGQFSDRRSKLAFASEAAVPQLRDLQNLWFLLLQELTANARNQRFSSSVINSQGRVEEAEIMRLGALVAFNQQGQYLNFNAQSKMLQVLPGQSANLVSQAQQFFSGASNSIKVDPQKGELLLQLSQIPSLEQRLHQGGTVGYIIMALGAVGLLIGSWRLIYMCWVNLLINRQLKSARASDKNALGRVLLAVAGATNVQRAELLIDESILRELPALQRAHSTVKLLAAVAPLLGLLGTVTGMIETFQSITLVGTSDPKLMAGGISQALITTVMGLCVAIPLLFCHSYISGQSKAILQRIQQQSLLLLSDYFVEPKTVSEGANAAV
ncbi:MAG: MotA/TolQ/ExbB proton channel family protein [Pseudomonadales bacterium]|nr:MotA/TolQ/ExbB proton channel family protein [Pseudomonadales bacterium]NRA15975.1 MotA/TolQ/ExbB proton channel family protein [Oceanospirillaceae bacterium]